MKNMAFSLAIGIGKAMKNMHYTGILCPDVFYVKA